MLHRLVAAIVGVVLLGSGCSAETAAPVDLAPAAPEPAESATEVPATPAQPTPVPPTAEPQPVPAATMVPPTPAPTPTPTPTATPRPLPTPVPTPTPVDTTPVVIDSGDGWTITGGDIARMIDFIEETHQLEFTGPVDVVVSDDIGAGRAATFEAFTEPAWFLIDALGLAGDQDREEANQFRRDRIRGVCCLFDPITSVAVEVQPTKLATELIVIHELVHALHSQHNDLFEGTSFRTNESPPPWAGAIEGIPQFVAYAYLDRAAPDLRAEVLYDLPIVRDDMLGPIAIGPARFLNFAYATGPEFVSAVVDANGIDGLFDLLGNPPTTTEQILFPEKYLSGEEAGLVPDPTVPENGEVRVEGTIGSALLLFMLTDLHGENAALQLVRPWRADSYVIYDLDGSRCLAVNVGMDTSGGSALFGSAFTESLVANGSTAEVVVSPELVQVSSCRPRS